MRSLVFACLFVSACGLYQGGSGGQDGLDAGVEGATDVAVLDVTSEPAPPLPCSEDASACVSALEPGWSPLAFALSRVNACPTGYTTEELVRDPVAQAGACVCDCTTVTPPSCAIGSLSGKNSNNNSCGQGTNGPYNITTDGECYGWGGPYNLAPYHNWTKLPLTPGTCTSKVTADETKVKVEEARACVPSARCAEDVCSGVVRAGFRACVAHDGDVPCPSGPFTERVLTGEKAALDCGACTACSATGSGCGAAKIDYYASNTCATSLATDTVDGACNFSANGVTGISHFKYTAAVLSPACTAGTSAPDPSLAEPRTICCRP